MVFHTPMRGKADSLLPSNIWEMESVIQSKPEQCDQPISTLRLLSPVPLSPQKLKP